MEVYQQTLEAAEKELRSAFPDAAVISVDNVNNLYADGAADRYWNVVIRFHGRKTIVAAGESLAEVVTVALAAKRRETEVDRLMAQAIWQHKEILEIEAKNRELAARIHTWPK